MLTRSQMLIAATLALGALLIFSLARPDRAIPQPPIADLSTPERALKSYWTLREWIRRTRTGESGNAATVPSVAEIMGAVTAGSTRDSYSSRPGARDPLGWTLEKVEQSSDTQAIATARIRNLAQNPQTVTPTPIELFEPAGGNQLQYVLNKEGAVWKVAEVWRIDDKGQRTKIR